MTDQDQTETRGFWVSYNLKETGKWRERSLSALSNDCGTGHHSKLALRPALQLMSFRRDLPRTASRRLLNCIERHLNIEVRFLTDV